MYLSALARQAGHEVRLVIEDARPNNKAIRAFDPDIIAFSVTTGTHIWALERATELKQTGRAIIVMGGPHATYYPEVILHPALDIIFRGESEYPFLTFLDRLDHRIDWFDIPNTWVKDGPTLIRNALSDLIENLDDLPPPDRTVYYDPYPYFRNNENKAFISGRGCPFSCTYCSIAGLRELYRGKGRFVRFHSPERVIQEIVEVRDRYGLRTVIFQDDTFIIGNDRLENLLSLYARHVKLPFVCHIRADLLTRNIARDLKTAGCHSVDFGVESGDERLRADVLGKPITDEQLLTAAGYLHDAGIPFRTTNMFGLPGETIDQAWHTVKLNQVLGTRFPSSSIYQPYPRTALGDRVIETGLAGKDYSVDSIGSTFFRTSLLDGKDKNSFINLQKLFWPAVRFPSINRIIRKMILLRPNPVYEFIFLLCYAINYALSERVSLRHVLNIGRRTARTVFFGKL
ncbi:B12-binding domain-containing radical SAM protein [bacterium]|nr:B12-binding domain-containing radical SAM protein [candidate division CSSED10-310 bacterium]